MISLPRSLAFSWLFVAGGLATAQTTWYVDVNATAPGLGTQAAPYSDVQYAIAQATTLAGDDLLVLPGTYVGLIDFMGKDIWVHSQAGPTTTTLDGNQAGSVVTFRSGEGPGAVLEGFTVTNGLGTIVGAGTSRFGGGVFCDGASPVLKDLVVTSNGLVSSPLQPLGGGGLYFNNSYAVIEDCTVLGNVAEHSGAGAYCIGGGCSFLGVDFTDNSALVCGQTQFGGGIASESSATSLQDCTISGNSAQRGGGFWGSGLLTNCSLNNNKGTAGGGGAWGGTLLNCEIVDNDTYACDMWYAASGGGVVEAHLTGCIIRGNLGGTYGGGALNSTLIDCELEGNRAGHSYEAYSGGGGGAAGSDLLRCQVFSNSARGLDGPADGGGVYQCTLEDCEIYDNTARGSWGTGGGAHTSTLTNCRIYGNEAISDYSWDTSRGGGAHASDLTSCEIYSNIADFGAATTGGALDRCTVVNNTALYGDAIVGWPMSVSNSIIWHNNGYSISSGGTPPIVDYSNVEGGWTGTTNHALDPQFQGLANSDYNLQPGSPCIDAGDPSYPLDEFGTRIEMGALTFDPGTPPGPVVYCAAGSIVVGTQLCTPAIAFSGTPTLSGADDFRILASGVTRNQPGLMFWGMSAANLPFMGGTLCVGAPLVRTTVMDSGNDGSIPSECSGTYSYFFSQAYMASHGLTVGSRIYCQYWFRNPVTTSPFPVGLTDALEVPIEF